MYRMVLLCTFAGRAEYLRKTADSGEGGIDLRQQIVT